MLQGEVDASSIDAITPPFNCSKQECLVFCGTWRGTYWRLSRHLLIQL